MAHFGYTRAMGVWATLTVLRASEIADLDAKTYKAVNGDEGGSWAPASAINIGGNGLVVSGPLAAYGPVGLLPTAFSVAVPGGEATLIIDSSNFRVLSSDGISGLKVDSAGAKPVGSWDWSDTQWPAAPITLAGDVSFGGIGKAFSFDCGYVHVKSNTHAVILDGAYLYATAGAHVSFDSAVAINGATTLGKVTATGDATLGKVTATGDATLAKVTANGEATFNGLTHLSGVTSLSAPMNVTSNINLFGAGHINHRVLIGDDADGYVISASTADIVWTPYFTGPRTWVLNKVGAAQGSIITIRWDSPSAALTITDTDGIPICIVGNTSDPPGQLTWVDLVLIGGSWRKLRWLPFDI